MFNSEGDIPLAIREFIYKNIRSVGHLEVLLLLARDPHKRWTADEVSRELRTNTSYALSQLNELVQSRLLSAEQTPLYSYLSNVEIDPLVLQLHGIYNSRRTTLINLIYSQPMEKIMGFADAFQLKKKE